MMAMRILALGIFLAIAASACTRQSSGLSSPAAPTGNSSTVTAPRQLLPILPTEIEVPLREITLGERVEGVVGDGRDSFVPQQSFSMTVPRRGRLTATLNNDPWPTGTL